MNISRESDSRKAIFCDLNNFSNNIIIQGPPGPQGPTTAPPTGCVSPDWANDDYCDDENNNADCNWDGGACCNNNAAGWDNYCSACECLDPNAGSGLDCEDKWKTKKCQKKANKGKIMTGSDTKAGSK